MRKYGTTFLLFLTLLPLPSNGALRKWNERMQELSGTLNDLLPEISRTTNSNPEALLKNAKKLSELVHSLDVQPGGMSLLPPDADPTLTMVQNVFERETKRAYQAIKQGNVEYGKGILRAAAGYCIACHSRNSNGPDFPSIKINPKNDSLTPFERAQLLAATRQFDGAIDAYSAIARDEAYLKSQPVEWTRAIQQALNLTVRVKEDPDRALALLNGATKLNAPQFFLEDASRWKNSLTAWKKEKAVELNSEAALHRKAKKLMDEAKAMQLFPVDRTANVLYLRASALLHEQLRRSPQGPLAAEALFLLGKAYESFGNLQSERWHELFYESCVRHRPHSPVARSCYEAYEASIYFGYTGSGGTALPEDVQLSLAELRRLAAKQK